MTDPIPPKVYHAYLIRVWCESGSRQWRGMVQRAGHSERKAFPDLLSVFAFIEGELAAILSQDETSSLIEPAGE